MTLSPASLIQARLPSRSACSALDCLEQRVLAREVVVERASAQGRLVQDHLDRGAVVAVLGEQAGGDAEDPVAGGGAPLCLEVHATTLDIPTISR
jgi:hypothetical protein